jgi:serine/threonine protein kinase
MLAERWREIESLYQSACQRAPEERHEYLEFATDDEQLRREVEALLANADRASRFLETDEPGKIRGVLEPAVPAGERIGPYVVLEFLAAGGMGEVYKAVDTRLQRAVAVKFLPRALATTPEALARFQREARAASSLNHPRICTVHDVGDFKGRPFLVMEFLEGQSLRDRIADKPVPIQELMDLGVQISDALQAAHAKGIVHRDIKPANIFVMANGQAKLLDFGLAKLVTDQHSAAVTAPVTKPATSTGATITRAEAMMGTAAYLSPEQARGEEVDTRSDIFSFGVVLYQMATGRPPFRGDTLDDLVAAILHQTPIKPSALNRGVPARLERIILRMLEKQPSARYQSAGEALAELNELQQLRRRRLARTAWFTAAFAISAVAVGVVIATRATERSGGVPEIVQRQVTANPVNDSVYFASISDDGKQVVYSDLRGVHLRVIDEGAVHDIPVPPEFCFR